MAAVDHLRLERLAYSLWQKRGRSIGSPHHDWLQAERLLGTRSPAVVTHAQLPAGWAPPSGWDLPSEWALPLFAFGMDPRGDDGDEHV
jgi:hypothetical protein